MQTVEDQNAVLRLIGSITVGLMGEQTTQTTLVSTAETRRRGMLDMQHIMIVLKVTAKTVTPEKVGHGEY